MEAGGDRLLERATELAVLDEALAAVRRSRDGRLVLIRGEAGIGKTALLRAFRAAHGDVATFWGGCDPLFTPRPLAPFLELADAAGGRLAARLARGRTPGDVLAALVEELPRRRPALLVIEDLHWADEATLDVVRLLGRRLEALPLLVLLSYRDERLDRAHALRIVLGDLSAPANRAARRRAALRRCGRGACGRRHGGCRCAGTADRRQSVLRDRGARGRRRGDAGDGPRRRARARRPARATGAARPGRRLDLPAACGAPAARGLRAGVSGRVGRVPGFGHAAPRGRGGRLPARDRPRRPRRRATRRTTGWRCTGRRCAPSRGRCRPIRPGSRTTQRARATARPCCAGRPRRRAGRRARRRTARRRSSMRGRCGRPTVWSRNGGRTCTSAARTSAT